MPDSSKQRDRSYYLILARDYAESHDLHWDPQAAECTYNPESNEWRVAMDEAPWGNSLWISFDAESDSLIEASILRRINCPISLAKAMSRAAEYAQSKGWPWSESPIATKDWEYDAKQQRHYVWRFDLNILTGANTQICIDAITGNVFSGHRTNM